MRSCNSILAMALLHVIGGGASGATIRVPADYPNIQDAIDVASDGDVVLVQPGTYLENLDFNGKAITVTGTAPGDSLVTAGTVVDAAGVGSVASFVSDETPSSVIAGLTLTGGVGTPRGSEEWGGGILCEGSSPSITECFVRRNTNDMANGVGMSCRGRSRPTVLRCTIESNYGSEGAGVHCRSSDPTFVDCIIRDNSIGDEWGGAWSRSVLL